MSGAVSAQSAREHFTGVSTLVFSPHERTLASGSTDGAVKSWSVATGQR
jgi:WD40 repeat protein